MQSGPRQDPGIRHRVASEGRQAGGWRQEKPEEERFREIRCHPQGGWAAAPGPAAPGGTEKQGESVLSAPWGRLPPPAGEEDQRQQVQLGEGRGRENQAEVT